MRLGTQALVLFLGNAFPNLCLGLPLQIYVARVLGAADLGVFSLIEAATGLLSGLLSFGIAAAVVKFIPQHLEKGEFQSIKATAATRRHGAGDRRRLCLCLHGSARSVCAGYGGRNLHNTKQ